MGLSVDAAVAGPIVLRVARRPVITYRGRHEFPVSPAELWDVIQEVDQFEAWWPWLEEFRLVGGSLQTGAVLSGVVAPPLPYRMRIEVVLTRYEPHHSIQALIHGDLEGEAAIELCERGVGTEVDVAWTVEMMQTPMRLADRLAHPVLQWGHDRVVELTVAGFRKRLRSAG
jgi:carbon monoxide dehydrogenase subunit G